MSFLLGPHTIKEITSMTSVFSILNNVITLNNMHVITCEEETVLVHRTFSLHADALSASIPLVAI